MMLDADFYLRKQSQIQAALADEGLDGLLLLDSHNVTYASGFWHIPSERPIGLYLPALGDPVLFVPLLERENAADCHVRDIRTYFEYPGETHPVVWMRRECGAKQLGIDAVDQAVFARLGEGVVMTPLVERMRWIKEPEELALIERAAHYADYCLEQVRDHAAAIIRDGGTELDILRMCLSATSTRIRTEVGEMFRLGGGAVVGTVHSGPRAALPHGAPGQRQPQPGEPLIAGIGVSVGGYHAESGATFVVGEPSAEVMRCLRAAADCDQAAIDALRPGATCASVNEAALAVLRNAGLGDAIRHRIGHGMGLQGHESPWLAPGDETLLVPGMVFSNEPGIYRPGRDGYRTIDTMIVTAGAAHVPSRFLADNPPERRILGN
ncbi:MAG: Xaa-Pro peptidase family protein [Chloroflexota bacterium]|nr:Xaa-Pro peptidase family protein [Chloroflexota bacterium]